MDEDWKWNDYLRKKMKMDCCGCGACVQHCPKQCITMKEDEEGFLYPVVDAGKCINCGLCEKVCPWINVQEKRFPLEVLAAKNKNEQERMDSSSGGVFIALARRVIAKGGVVFGAVFDENWEVHHTYAETLEDIKPMMGSKYLQSRMENSYCQAEAFLKEGREVLFSGTPCQIAGLHAYLRKDYSNLLSVDLICHGVPSPGIWRKYIHETFDSISSARRAVAGKNTVLSLSLNSMPGITGIKFRDKKMSGWKKYSFVVQGTSASKADQNSVLLSNIHYTNPFMRGFLSNIYLRPACYGCKCKSGVSHSDLTIADFWGIQNIMPDFDDDKGTGLILVGGEKGEQMLESIGLETRLSSMEDAVLRFNRSYMEPPAPHPDRANFFKYVSKGMTVDRSVEAIFSVPLYKRVYRRLKRMIKTCFKF